MQLLRQYGDLYQTLAEDILDYVLALDSVETKILKKYVRWVNLWEVSRNKSRTFESAVICPLIIFGFLLDWFRGAFFTNITFPEGFCVTRKTDGVLFQDSEQLGCVSYPAIADYT